MIAALDALEVITLFVEDVARSKAFYGGAFTHEIVYEDAVCSIMKFGSLAINLLNVSEAPGLVAPARVAPQGVGARALYTIKVADADAVCAELRRRGYALLNGPLDRPWGRRTAAFSDPDGNVWEIAQELPPLAK